MKKNIQIIIILFIVLGTIEAHSLTIGFLNPIKVAKTTNFISFTAPSKIKIISFTLENDGTPKDFALHQNFPNPFNPVTSISYDIPRESYVTLKVFNILGQEVAQLVARNHKPGTYSVKFDATGLNSGFYIYRLQADDFSMVRKMLFLK